MRALVQRARRAHVSVDGERVGEIGSGLLVLLGVGQGDTEAICAKMAAKVARLRIFPDADDRMNLGLLDAGGECLVVSQFTLYADCNRGRRPYFGNAEDPERATELCDYFVDQLKGLGVSTQTGRFGAMMDVELVNDGPVTIMLDSAETSADA